MMKIKEEFIASDGVSFDTEDSCIAHENLLNEIDAILDTLPELPRASEAPRFLFGEGYIQHDVAKFLAARNAFLQIAIRLRGSSNEILDQALVDQNSTTSLDITALVYGANRFLGELWWRFECMDNEFREWGGPSYARYPRKHFQIN
jgi:hypothetical protein